LVEWVYQRQVFSLEGMIHLLTDVPARLYGLKGKGRIRPGYAADLVMFDPARLGSSPMQVVRDLPAGAPRLMSDPSGVVRVLVGGTEIYRDNVATGDLPGRLLRSGQDSTTVTPADWIAHVERAGRALAV